MDYQERALDFYSTVEDVIVNGEIGDIRPQFKMSLVKKVDFLKQASAMNYQKYETSGSKKKTNQDPNHSKDSSTSED